MIRYTPLLAKVGGRRMLPQPRTAVRGCQRPDADVLVFLHGWPDIEEVFAQQYEAFAATHRMVSIGIPGFDRPGSIPFFGIDFHVAVSMMTDALDAAIGKASAGSSKRIAVCHDWGVFIAREMMVRDSGVFDRCIFLDVGGHTGNPTRAQVVFTFLYQLALILLFFAPRSVSTWVARKMVAAGQAPSSSVRSADGRMNYMYVRLWWGLLTQRAKYRSFTDWVLPDRLPMLFLFGTDKPISFHSARFLQHMQTAPECRCRSYPAGHWFFTAPQWSSAVNDEIRTFVT